MYRRIFAISYTSIMLPLTAFILIFVHVPLAPRLFLAGVFGFLVFFISGAVLMQQEKYLERRNKKNEGSN